MKIVADNAGLEWQRQALQALHDYAVDNSGFLIQAVRAFAEQRGVQAPHDAGAWGAVTRQAARRGFIACEGYSVKGSSNASPKPVWKSLIRKAPPSEGLA
jgi:hypothetical protein